MFHFFIIYCVLQNTYASASFFLMLIFISRGDCRLGGYPKCYSLPFSFKKSFQQPKNLHELHVQFLLVLFPSGFQIDVCQIILNYSVYWDTNHYIEKSCLVTNNFWFLFCLIQCLLLFVIIKSWCHFLIAQTPFHASPESQLTKTTLALAG